MTSIIFDRLRHILIVGFLLLISFDPIIGGANDARSAVLSRMTATTAIKIPYKEVREIDLLEEPWIGTGYFYINPPDTVIRYQTNPSHMVLAAKGKRMWFYDMDNNLRQGSDVVSDEPIGLMVSIFQSIVNGDQQNLLGQYDDDFVSNENSWELTLKPKPSKTVSEITHITLSGKSESEVNEFVVFQSDGDSTTFHLGSIEAGSQLESEIRQLLAGAQGD